MTDINEQSVVTETELNLGEKLKFAREQKKITIAEVAAQLRLLQENIQSLEASQWENLHGRAYARGYFLSYVRFLGLPEAEMLTAFNHEYKSLPQESMPKTVLLDDKRKSFPWLSLIFVVIVIAAVIGAYMQWQQAETERLAIESQLEIEAQEAERSFAESVIEPISDAVDGETVISDVETIAGDTVEEIISLDSGENENIGSLNQNESVEELEQLELSSENNAVPTNVEQENMTEQTPIISLSFNDDCWVEVSDSTGKSVINDMLKKGSSVTLEGQAPFTILLGQASAVSVTINDEEFDLSRYSKNNVARFTIGEQ